MPGSMPATSQLDWLSSMTAMIVLFWSRATRDLLKSFGWGIAGTPSIRYSDEVAISRRPPHSIYRSEEHTSELQSLRHLVCRLLLEKKKTRCRDTALINAKIAVLDFNPRSSDS